MKEEGLWVQCVLPASCLPSSRVSSLGCRSGWQYCRYMELSLEERRGSVVQPLSV